MTTWNPADKGVDVTLTGSNLIATATHPSTMGVRATTSKSSGLWYFETIVGFGGGTGNFSIGIANGTWSVGSNQLGFDNNSIGYRADGSIYAQTVTLLFSGAALATNDVIGIAFDATSRSIKFYKNNVLQYTASGVNVPTGALFPAYSGTGGGVNSSATANFGATATTYTPPAGYSTIDSALLDFSITTDGGVLVGGEADIAGALVIMDGGIVVGGAADFVFKLALVATMDGGVVVGGAADIDFSRATVYNLSDDDVPSGGLRWNGAALVQEAIKYVSSGGFKWGGEGVVQENIPFKPTGGLLWGGAAGISGVNPFVASGGFAWGGAADHHGVFNHTPDGGIQWSGAAAHDQRYAFVASGGVKWGGGATFDEKHPYHLPTGGYMWGGDAVVFFVPAGYVATTENPGAEVFPGMAVNMENFAASRYTGLAANSMTRFNGKTFVANAGGVYEMGADDDAGQPIRASIQFPTTDYGKSQEKYMEVAYVGLRTQGNMRMKVLVNTSAVQYYPIITTNTTPKGIRVPIGKGLRGRYWGMRLDNVDGADFELESVEFIPYAGQRRGA